MDLEKGIVLYLLEERILGNWDRVNSSVVLIIDEGQVILKKMMIGLKRMKMRWISR